MAQAVMTQEVWTAVDDYFSNLLAPADAALEEALRSSTAASLPPINVSATQGKLLQLLARILGARNILEIGTLGAYSTIWMARALPAGGKVITLEADAKHADVARKNIAFAGLDDKIALRFGPALETLPNIAAEKLPPFDLSFIDANKSQMPEYFSWCLKLTRPGGMIIADNVVRSGNVVDANTANADIQGIRRFLEIAAKEPRVSATALQTVNSKGYDGFAVLLVNEAP
jgi:predicted O-methyltransferase YrrM